MPEKRTLYRLPKEGKILGVCAGIADYFDMDVTLTRVIFMILVFITGGTMILVYIVLAIIMPSSERVGKDNEGLGKKIETLGSELRDNSGIYRLKNYFGISLLVIGVWLLLGEFFPDWANLRWAIIWPSVLILTGAFVLTKGKKS